MRGASSGWWYAVAGLLALLGLGGALWAGVSAASVAADADVHAVPADGTITIGDHRTAVYVDGRRAPGLECSATSADGDPVPFDPPGSTSLEINEWTYVARSPSSAAPGTYTLTCESRVDPLAEPRLGTGDYPRIVAILVRVVIAFVVGASGVVLGILVAVITAVRSRRRRRPPGPAPGGPAQWRPV